MIPARAAPTRDEVRKLEQATGGRKPAGVVWVHRTASPVQCASKEKTNVS